MKSLMAAAHLPLDYSVTPDVDMPAAKEYETRQSAEDFRAAFVAMIPQLRAFARLLCDDKNSAEKLSRMTVAEAWRSRLAAGPEANVKAWLFMIARNKFYSNYRQEWREAALEQTVAKRNAEYNAEQIRSAYAPDALRALWLLPDQFREALILVSASGCSYEESAQICGCPVGTVKSRVFRARQALMAILETASFV